MPTFDGATGRVYYKAWRVPEPRDAAVVGRARHDILNETVHREAAAAIIGFVRDLSPQPGAATVSRR